MRKVWVGLTAIIILLGVGYFVAVKHVPEAQANIRPTLNHLYQDYVKESDPVLKDEIKWEMCALAVNSDPSEVPSKVTDTCNSW